MKVVYDFIVRVVGGEGYKPVTRDNQGFGYLPIIKDEHGKEIYRGDFKQSAKEDLNDCINRMPRVCD